MPNQVTIFTSDNFQLKGLLFESNQSLKGAIVLNVGLGIPKEYYKPYASFLADSGYSCLIFDYRGIGESIGDSQQEHSVNLRNWGLIDMVGALDFLKYKYPDKKLYLFGHSIGGQLVGLMKNHHLIEQIIMIAATNGYWKLFNFPLNLLSAFMWYVHIPITTRLFGYLPKSLTYRGVSIAKGVALEWAAWSRNRNYIAAFFGKTISQEYYREITQKIDVIWFTDDQIVTPKTLDGILDYYPNASITKHPINPKIYGLKRVGHSGFFSPKFGKKFWALPLQFIEGN